jgi:hypothetical protein
LRRFRRLQHGRLVLRFHRLDRFRERVRAALVPLLINLQTPPDEFYLTDSPASAVRPFDYLRFPIGT